jgi:hypothetical protein
MDSDTIGMDRRGFLKRAGLAGAATVWAAPVVQTMAAGPAFATNGTPVVGECGHSFGTAVGTEGTACEDEGCMGACQTACERGCFGDLEADAQQAGCQQACNQLCPNIMGDWPDGSPNRSCCNVGVCVLANWSCTPGPNAPSDVPCYNGPTAGGLFTCPIGCL